MKSKVTTPPAIEPVTLDEVKSSLRITNAAEDTLLTQYIQDARVFVERKTGRKLIDQTITAYYDGFDYDGKGDDWWSGHRMGAVTEVHGGQKLCLEFAPVASITSLNAVAGDGSETLVDSSEYYLDNYDDDTRSFLRSENGITKGTRKQNNLKVVYQAGYGANASDVPSALRRAIIALVGSIYSSRGDCSTESCADSCGVSKMIQQYALDLLR